jgi:4-carboxymuconolactone decarboxylase
MTRPIAPRIAPVDPATMSDSQRAFAGIGASNVIRTLVRHEDLLKAWLGLAQNLLLSGRVSPRDRELAILRVALRTDCEYEWANHVLGAIAAGASVDEIRALANASAAWSDSDMALLRAVDELCADDCVSDSTWAALAATRDDQQLIEVLCLIGYYRMNAGLLNSMGVQPEPGRPRLGQVPVASPASSPQPPAHVPGKPATTPRDKPTGIGGTWQVIFHHPTGDQHLALMLHSNNGAISGSVSNPALGMTVEIVAGTADGCRFWFSAPMTTPIQVDISYAGVVDGDAIAGDVTIGGSGNFPFDGTRSTATVQE